MSGITVDVRSQTLTLRDEQGRVVMEAGISTASNGVGEKKGSECTPRGRHVIRARIGAGQAINMVFVGRRPTGEIYSPGLRQLYPQRDWILTRLLWLSGTEIGKNRLGDVDTMQRYVYIHGAPADDTIGVPGSRGCIKMRNDVIIELFDRVDVGTPVNIIAE